MAFHRKIVSWFVFSVFSFQSYACCDFFKKNKSSLRTKFSLQGSENEGSALSVAVKKKIFIAKKSNAFLNRFFRVTQNNHLKNRTKALERFLIFYQKLTEQYWLKPCESSGNFCPAEEVLDFTIEIIKREKSEKRMRAFKNFLEWAEENKIYSYLASYEQVFYTHLFGSFVYIGEERMTDQRNGLISSPRRNQELLVLSE